jgi:hypothetical protein
VQALQVLWDWQQLLQQVLQVLPLAYASLRSPDTAAAAAGYLALCCQTAAAAFLQLLSAALLEHGTALPCCPCLHQVPLLLLPLLHRPCQQLQHALLCRLLLLVLL